MNQLAPFPASSRAPIPSIEVDWTLTYKIDGFVLFEEDVTVGIDTGWGWEDRFICSIEFVDPYTRQNVIITKAHPLFKEFCRVLDTDNFWERVAQEMGK